MSGFEYSEVGEEEEGRERTEEEEGFLNQFCRITHPTICSCCDI